MSRALDLHFLSEGIMMSDPSIGLNLIPYVANERPVSKIYDEVIAWIKEGHGTTRGIRHDELHQFCLELEKEVEVEKPEVVTRKDWMGLKEENHLCNSYYEKH